MNLNPKPDSSPQNLKRSRASDRRHELHGVTVAGGPIEHSCHACAFFNSREEHDRVLLPFLREGLEAGEKGVQIVDPLVKEERLERIHGFLEDPAGLQDGQLEVLDWFQAYLRDGIFEMHKMIDLIQMVLNRSRDSGFPMTRVLADMEWALENKPGVRDLIEYEARLNSVLPQYDDIVICSYDLTRFDATTVIDIMRVHPSVIIGGVLRENPFYVPPEQFLAESECR